MKCGTGRNRKGQWCLTETSSYKMTNHFGQFNANAEAQFNELASEKYGECGQGEKMVFGKCAKVGGSGKKQVPDSLKKSKATVEAQLASAKKRKSANQIRKAEKALASVNAKIDSYNSSEEPEFKQGGCPDGFRSKGSQTISGKRREVCCTPDGKICMTADGIPL